MFEQLPDTDVDSSKNELALPINIPKINATVMKEENDEGKEIEYSLSIKN